jgi:hypothetical protein
MTKHEDLDAILAADEELVPSPGFLTAVMGRIHEEAAAPSPIPFPWKRAVPGMALIAGALGWGVIELLRQEISFTQLVMFAPPHLSASMVHPLEEAGWVAVSLAASLASWLLSRRLAGRSGLL